MSLWVSKDPGKYGVGGAGGGGGGLRNAINVHFAVLISSVSLGCRNVQVVSEPYYNWSGLDLGQ